MLRILIADDAPFIREVLRQIITRGGHTVVAEAEDGEQALKLSLKHRPDVILMDIVMPVKSGIQATEEILAEWPEARVIACTTVDQDLMMSKAMNAGSIEFLHKPFAAKTVLDVLERVAAHD